jgi:hypothetical protein
MVLNSPPMSIYLRISMWMIRYETCYTTSINSKDPIEARYEADPFLWIGQGKSTRTGGFRFVPGMYHHLLEHSIMID